MTASERDPLARAASASRVDEDAERPDVLGPALRADLSAWVDELVPADDVWPAAAAVGAARYVEQVASRVPALLAELTGMLVEAGTRAAVFAELGGADRREQMLRAEAGPRAATFRRVYVLVCEQYYRAPDVVDVVLERTGFDTARPTVGAPMMPFDPTRLDRVRALPKRFPERA